MDPITIHKPNVSPAVNEAQEKKVLCQVVDERTTWERVADVVLCIWATVKMVGTYIMNFAFFFIHREEFEVEPTRENAQAPWLYAVDEAPWSHADESEGLYFFVPGLNAPTLSWSPYVKELRENVPNMHLVIPSLINQGNGSIEEVGTPLVALMKDYLQKFPGKPIHLIGTSRGGQLAAYIEKELSVDEMRGRDFSVVTIAGVHFGTRLIDWLKDYHLLPLSGLKEETIEELYWKNQTAEELLHNWRSKQEEWQANGIRARHLILGTVNDEMVSPYHSSLPYLPGNKVDYQLMRGETHISIVSNAKETVFDWLRS